MKFLEEKWGAGRQVVLLAFQTKRENGVNTWFLLCLLCGLVGCGGMWGVMGFCWGLVSEEELSLKGKLPRGRSRLFFAPIPPKTPKKRRSPQQKLLWKYRFLIGGEKGELPRDAVKKKKSSDLAIRTSTKSLGICLPAILPGDGSTFRNETRKRTPENRKNEQNRRKISRITEDSTTCTA